MVPTPEQIERVRAQGRYTVDYGPGCHEDNVEIKAAMDACADAAEQISTPHTSDFLFAVRLEAAHQRARWTAEHDAGKTDADWFWLIGYLAGKAIHKPEKQLHHIITTAAACLNWHMARTVGNTMRPGTSQSDGSAES